jgi:hypothetical protein
MVGVRLPAAMLRKIGKIAAALSCNRSAAIRWSLDVAMDSGQACALLRSGKGRRLTDAIVLAAAAEMKAKAAADAVERARPTDKLRAEINALRAEEQAAERQASAQDRLKGREQAKRIAQAAIEKAQKQVAARRSGS